MKIFITGIGGFLGRALAERMLALGYAVQGSTRSEMELGSPFHSDVFEGQDAVIHCAHDFSPGAQERNVAGTKAWMSVAADCGVRQQIFLSSYSARADAASEYGRTKYELERMFLERGFTVLRPGLVMGEGGLFARQRATLLRSPIVPMLGDGAQPVATISVDDFVDAADAVIAARRTGAFNLFYEPTPTYRDFVRGIRAGRFTLFLPVPARLAFSLAAAAEWLRLPLPFTRAQMRALMANESAPRRSDLNELLKAAERLDRCRFPPPG